MIETEDCYGLSGIGIVFESVADMAKVKWPRSADSRAEARILPSQPNNPSFINQSIFPLVPLAYFDAHHMIPR